MKRNLNISIASIVFALMIVHSSTAHAVKWCGSFKADYDDAGYGEDRDTSGAETSYPARYAKAGLYELVGLNWVLRWSGNMDYLGCSPDRTAPSSGSWWILRLYSELQRDNRVFKIQGVNNSSWNGTPVYFDSLYLTPNPAPTTSIDVPAANRTHVSGLSAILGRVMQYSNTLDIPNGISVWIGTEDSTLCPNGAYYDNYVSGNHQVCLPNTDQRKFMTVHEMGHVIAKANNGPKYGTYGGDQSPFADTNPDCLCSNCAGANQSHCLHSREFIGSAAKEGFSHFIAAATYNNGNQTTSNGGFAYYKQVAEGTFNPDGDPDDCHPTPYRVDITGDDADGVEDTDDDLVKWMETECNPDNDNIDAMGSEWDWLVFFWNLYTIGDYAFDVDEINNVWAGVPDYKAYWCCMGSACGQYTSSSYDCQLWEVIKGKPWDDLSDWVYSNMNGYEYLQFYLRGIDAAVDY